MIYLAALVVILLLLTLLGGIYMAVDLSTEFAKLDKSIADLPARVAAAVAAAQAGAIQPADVAAAADARAAQVDAILPAAPTPAA
jgi:hypothetical protein